VVSQAGVGAEINENQLGTGLFDRKPLFCTDAGLPFRQGPLDHDAES
jgi:hypothetical protein